MKCSKGSPAASLPPRRQQRCKAGRRNRVPLSYGPCRSRKSLSRRLIMEMIIGWPPLRLRCDREQLCQICTVRREQATYIYSGLDHDARSSKANVHVDDMQQEIIRLENLVTDSLFQSQDQRMVGPCANRPLAEDGSQVQTSRCSGPVVQYGSSCREQTKPGAGVIRLNEHFSLYRGATHWSDVLEELCTLSCRTNQKI